VIILDTLLIGGIKFVFRKLAEAVDAQLNDDSVLREELLAAQMRLELGEIDEAQFTEIETELLQRIREIRERTRGAAVEPGDYKITGIEATFGGDERDDDEDTDTDARRR
jgi:gas vesicle protein GvpG